MEEQPLGAELFKQFCQGNAQLSKCVEFVLELDTLQLVAEEKCAAMAQRVFDNFISSEVCKGVVWGHGRGGMGVGWGHGRGGMGVVWGHGRGGIHVWEGAVGCEGGVVWEVDGLWVGPGGGGMWVGLEWEEWREG